MSQLWAFSISFAKLSMLAVYHRYFDVKYMKVGVKLCTAYVVVLLLVMLILESTICLPWGSQWNISAVETWCGQRQSRLFIASSAFHTLSDLVILVLPIPCIWSLQLPRKKKISLSIMFSAGIMYVFFSCCLPTTIKTSKVTKKTASPSSASSASGPSPSQTGPTCSTPSGGPCSCPSSSRP